MTPSHEPPYPDHKPQITRLRRIQGQVEGIQAMIEDGRYCPEIITQIQAARAALKSLEALILEKHLKHCMMEAFQLTNSAKKNKKISELLNLFKRS